MGFSSDQHIRSAQSTDRDVRRARVSKACERCRLKKIKCDGEVPCSKCRNSGHVCTPGTRKRTIHVEYEQVPKSYVEFLETTHLALIGSVHKLYTMIQKNQPWNLDSPELNDQGELVIHDLAKKLGCIDSNGEIQLPIQYELPITTAGMARLAARPERQQYQGNDDEELEDYKEADPPMAIHTDDDSPSSELLECEFSYRKEAFADYNSSITHSPQSLYSNDDSEHSYSGSERTSSCVTTPPNASLLTIFSDFSPSQPGSEPDEMAAFYEQYGQTLDMSMLNWDLGELDFNAPKRDLPRIPDFGMMMNDDGQMMLPEYNDHSAWLSQTLGWGGENQISLESSNI
ncbi:hypothetical protein V8C35DRAFT_332305 [Trichoderma chlorosporum]